MAAMSNPIGSRAEKRSWYKLLAQASEIAVLVVVLAAAVVILRQLWWKRSADRAVRTTVAVPAAPVALDNAPVKGETTARAVMIVYSDFQCPFCGVFARETLPVLVSEYVNNGKLAIAFKNLPLSLIHPLARDAATAGVCAHRQGRFWQWHDALFARDVDLQRDGIAVATRAGNVEPVALATCQQEKSVADQVDREANQARALGIRSTPAFVIGTMGPKGSVSATAVMVGAQPVSKFRAALDQITSNR